MINERVFVSGGAGVIGRELVPLLVARGAEVFVGDLKSRPAELDSAVRYRQGDLNYLTAAELEGFAPTLFIHLAATFERSTETYEFWEENYWHNIRLSHHLMTLHRNLDSLERVVFASSYLIYEPSLYQFDGPQPSARALLEADPVLPRNLTGMAKLAHEIELRFLESFRSEQFSSVSARIYRGFGCNSRDVISRWVRAALKGKPLTVFRPEGRFDYIFARDIAEGLIRLADAADVTGVINLGTGRARQVADVVAVLQEHFPDLEIMEGESHIPFEASCADMSRFEERVDWLPRYELEQAIPEIIAHEKDKREAQSTREIGNILLSSASRKVPLMESLKTAARKMHPAIKVFAGDLDPRAPAALVSDGFLTLPPTDDENLDSLLRLCRDNEIGLIIPSRDGELSFWARHADSFRAQGTEVIVSRPEAITRCVDKLEFAVHGARHSLPIIEARETLEGEGPFVVKERFGAGGRSIGLNLDREAARAHASTLEDAIFQPYIHGTEISVDAWLDRKHRVKGLVLRYRNQVVDGESRVTTTFRDTALERTCRDVLETLSLRGPVVLQLLRDRDGQPNVIEVNARFGGASTSSIATGLDSWYWTLLEVSGADLADAPFFRSESEVRQIRVSSDILQYGSDF